MISLLGTFSEQWEIEAPPGAFGSTLFVCTHCCKPWGMLCVPGDWEFRTCPTPCLDCGASEWDRQQIPGSFLGVRANVSGIRLPLLHYLPPALLERELTLHIAALENLPDECTDS